MQAELEDLLGVSLDLVTPADLPARFRQRTLTTRGSPHRMRELWSME
jgi:hypothetical protein